MERSELIATTDFCAYYHVSYAFIHGLSEAGLIEIVIYEEAEYVHTDQIKELEKLARFHTDMDINLEGIEVIARLLQQMETLQQELRGLKQRLGLYE